MKPARTVHLRVLTREVRREGRVAGKLLLLHAVARPVTRGDCEAGPRPCPWVSCRWHLAIDTKSNGSLVHNGDVETMAETCALDVAAEGGASQERVGELLGLSGEGVRQIELAALAAIRATGRLP